MAQLGGQMPVGGVGGDNRIGWEGEVCVGLGGFHHQILRLGPLLISHKLSLSYILWAEALISDNKILDCSHLHPKA